MEITIIGEIGSLSVLSGFWDRKTVEQYPYTYYVWLGKCPICLWDLERGEIQELDLKGLTICPHCKSRVEVNWMGIGKRILEFIGKKGKPLFLEILFGEVCEKLKMEDFFIVMFGSTDPDCADNYMSIILEHPEIVKRFFTPSHNLGFFCRSDEETQKLFGFRNLHNQSIILLSIAVRQLSSTDEDCRLFTLVENHNRQKYARFFKEHYDEVMKNCSFKGIVLD
jgi:hypothetical protein